ncbi:unnamed protein product [Phyllotreta striolata]|uniref:Uncharacterized protein n=1 Tax=Phyllotreta striolata TaxID=444603 RepID=A0A9N9XJ42_PHYSR|nr:unnamed protein product [Phyllotreta striolata]
MSCSCGGKCAGRCLASPPHNKPPGCCGVPCLPIAPRYNMRDRERELWSLGTGKFLSHSEDLENGLHSLQLERLDALICIEGEKELEKFA